MTYTALICARGGSKGVPGKNLRQLAGRPLIAWAISHARATARINRVMVSTDSEEIAKVARDAGADVPFLRPASLAGDTSPEWLVWRHAIEHMRASDGKLPRGLVVIPCTAPLRATEDIDQCIVEFEKPGTDVVITVTDAHRSPYFNMVKREPEGYVSLLIPPPDNIFRRQDAPSVYDMTTVAYVVDPAFVMNNSGLFAGRVRSVHVPPQRALDIDTLLDLRIAEFLMSEKK